MKLPDSSHQLFPYAYNILGSADDAKDVVQDVLTRHLTGTHRAPIENEKAYLIRSVVNAAITWKNRQQKTLRAGEVWLPEPVATDDAADRNLQLSDILSYSLLVLMERLSATERAVFILKESFEYSHEEIADVLSITEAHSRKLLSRAKAKLFKPGPPPGERQKQDQQAILEGFLAAIRKRDTATLEQLMVADIRFYADGGGTVPLAAGTCLGARDVAALQVGIYHRFLTTARMVVTTINHQPALLSYVDGRLTACQVFDLHPGHGTILQINAVLDPAKLKSLAARF